MVRITAGIVHLLNFSYFFPSGIVPQCTREKRMATAVESIRNLKSAVTFLLHDRRLSVVSFSFFLTDIVSHIRLFSLSMEGEVPPES